RQARPRHGGPWFASSEVAETASPLFCFPPTAVCVATPSPASVAPPFAPPAGTISHFNLVRYAPAAARAWVCPTLARAAMRFAGRAVWLLLRLSGRLRMGFTAGR